MPKLNNNIYKYSNYNTLSKAAAAHIFSRINAGETIHIGLATGYSPKLAYAYLADYLIEHPSLISNINCFQLDEWLGLSLKNPGSCQQYLFEHIIRPWNLDPGQYSLINGQAIEQEQQLDKMKNMLFKNPLDLCILGMGKNGHLAFNEPGSSVKDSCRIVQLANSSKKHEMLGVMKGTLDKGITIGLKEIMEAKELLLIVSGEGKSQACKKLLEKVTPFEFPASVVYQHDNYSILIDEETLNYAL